MAPSGIHWIFSLQVFPPREYCQFIPKRYSRGSSKQVFKYSNFYLDFKVFSNCLRFFTFNFDFYSFSFHVILIIIPVQHSPPVRKKISQARAQAVLTQTQRDPLDGNPEVTQLRACLDRGPNWEGEAQSRKEGRRPRSSNSFSGVAVAFPSMSRTTLKGPGEEFDEGKKNSVEEEESDGTESVPAPVGPLKVLEDQLYPSLISLSLNLLNHPYWPLCNK
ncbi:hypothetical protein O181_012824 [Austropuccinia psidii MF-1]|uniref:Uncharacterized protein n=1 Tax=Austropuccinia psidii MF-1 TaxID=1389203 RepID=A0A9Q3GN86_9BASI|nr:hypothetical protein [Austropuccinia psidii MF-1]